MNLKEFLLKADGARNEAPRWMTEATRPIRVLIIQPPALHGVGSFIPQVKEGTEGIGFKPPQGILYVAAMLKASSPHVVKVVDAQAQRLDFDDLVAEARRFQPDLVGISAWTDFWYPAYVTGQKIKQAVPGCHLTYGGPHVGIYPQETLNLPFVDSVVVGDGEVPFLYLCNLVANGKVNNSFPGVHFKAYGVKPPPDQLYVHGDLDSLPRPNRTMLPIEAYTSVLFRDRYTTTMITSRGCPHRCTFCKLNFQKTLARSAESVVAEFREIAALGIREVEIYDDTFTWGRQRLRDICEGLIEADLGIEWAVRDRVTRPDPELLQLMYRAGCRRIHYGVESGVDAVLERMKKRITTDEARHAVRLAKEAGLTVLTYFMFGNLDETADDMIKTVDFALELRADYATFSITIPYAGTEMYEEALAKGIIPYDFWLEFSRNPVPDFVPPHLIENRVSLNEMLDIRNRAIRQFYFRPRYVARELASLSTFGEFVRKTRMGARLLQSVYMQ